MRLARLADAGLDAVPQTEPTVLGAVVSGVRVQLADGGADDLGQAQEMGEEPRVVDVGGRGNHGQRGMPSVETTTWYLVPALPRSVGLGPVSSPPRVARTEQLSTTTSEGASSGPERTIRTRTTWTRRSTAVALQSSRRRRKVEPQARPAVARSSRHCTPSRAKNLSASTTLMVGRGGRPVPKGRSSIRSTIPATNSAALDPMLASPCQRHGKLTRG
jgi:hypothetical protein